MSRTEIWKQAIIKKGFVLQDGVIECDYDLTIEGDIQVKKIDCKNNTIFISKGARIDADVAAETAIIQGEVMGNVEASNMIELKYPGTVHGDMTTSHFQMDKDVAFHGKLFYR